MTTTSSEKPRKRFVAWLAMESEVENMDEEKLKDFISDQLQDLEDAGWIDAYGVVVRMLQPGEEPHPLRIELPTKVD